MILRVKQDYRGYTKTDCSLVYYTTKGLYMSSGGVTRTITVKHRVFGHAKHCPSVTPRWTMVDCTFTYPHTVTMPCQYAGNAYLGDLDSPIIEVFNLKTHCVTDEIQVYTGTDRSSICVR